MIEIGRSLPNLTGPTLTIGAAEILAFKGVSFPFRADHVDPRHLINPGYVRVAPNFT
jgi:hypothetical protein